MTKRRLSALKAPVGARLAREGVESDNIYVQ